jgi:hypothetical protein
LQLSLRHDTETFDSETFLDSDEYALFVGFTVNSVLTSVFEVQGADHPVFLAKKSRLTFEHFFRQRDRAKIAHLAVESPHLAPSWNNDILPQ